jgi:hypothetical protein
VAETTPNGYCWWLKHPHGAKGVAETIPNHHLGVVSATPLAQGGGRASPIQPDGHPQMGKILFFFFFSLFSFLFFSFLFFSFFEKKNIFF